MSVTDTEQPQKSFKPILLGIALSAGLGAAGFYAVYSGMILGSDAVEHTKSNSDETMESLDPIHFVAIEPLMVSISSGNGVQNLRFEGHLEVNPSYSADIETLMPRIMDVLNSYLRAVEIADLRDPNTLLVLRAQMLRRIQVVTGDGRVRDLLVTKFLVS